MSGPDLEAQLTPRIKDSLNLAIQQTGKDEFAKLSGIEGRVIDGLLRGEAEYVPLNIVTLACQLNKSHGNSEPSRTSISECLKGAILRMPQRTAPETVLTGESSTERSRRARFSKPPRRGRGIYDPTALRIMGFSVNFFVFVVLGYFLGGVVLGPLFGFESCLGVVATSPWITPCAGSGIGLVVGVILGIAYTYYYFVKKL